MNVIRQNVWWLFLSLIISSQAWSQEADVTDGETGALIWAHTCDRCHNARDPQEFRDDQWSVIISHMRVRAGLTGSDAREVLAFLQASNQPTPIRTNGSTSQLPANIELPESAQADSVAGAAVYLRTCVACHGADGEGVLPSVADLTDSAGVLSKTDQELAESIWNGYQSSRSTLAMPAKGGDLSLTPQDMMNVLAYMRERFSGNTPAN